MDASMFGFIEAALVFGVVVGWGGRELWLLRQDKAAREKAQREQMGESVTAPAASAGAARDDNRPH